MDPITAISLIGNALEIIVKVSYLLSVSEYQDYGLLRWTLLNTVLTQAKGTIARIKTHVIGSPEHEIEAALVRETYIKSFNMIAVAAAIVAQIAITALSLAHIEEVHWTAEACFVASLISGLFSVYFAYLLVIKLGDLHKDRDVLEWLVDSSARRARLAATDHVSTVLAERIVAKGDIPSFSAVLMLVGPAQLLNWSVILFIAGAGVYYGQLFSNGLGTESGANANLAVLLVYILTTVAAAAVLYIPFLWDTARQHNIRKLNERIQHNSIENYLQISAPNGGRDMEAYWRRVEEEDRQRLEDLATAWNKAHSGETAENPDTSPSPALPQHGTVSVEALNEKLQGLIEAISALQQQLGTSRLNEIQRAQS